MKKRKLAGAWANTGRSVATVTIALRRASALKRISRMTRKKHGASSRAYKEAVRAEKIAVRSFKRLAKHALGEG